MAVRTARGVFEDGSPHSERRWCYEVHTKDNSLYDYTFHSVCTARYARSIKAN